MIDQFKKKERSREKRQGKSDMILFILILMLITVGLVMIASAGIAYSKTRFADPYYFFKHQLLYGILPGLIIMYLVARVDYKYFRVFSVLFFGISLIFLMLVFVPGIGFKIYGASRWMQLGPFSFQPSEMLKLAIILYLAAWLAKREEKVQDVWEGVIPFLVILAIVSFLLIKQPDVGTLGIIILISLTIFFISGARIKHLMWIFVGGLAGLLALIKFESYRMNRLIVFMHPEVDPQGIGYQINQALLAIGSGGFWGVGLGYSRQKFSYLPEPVGDSIFAIISEELGFVGGVVLVILFVLVGLRIFKIASGAPDKFAALTAAGIGAWIMGQAFLNISAICGLTPLTGVPLPFISYGGTSITFLLIGVGILLNISKQSKLN